MDADVINATNELANNLGVVWFVLFFLVLTIIGMVIVSVMGLRFLGRREHYDEKLGQTRMELETKLKQRELELQSQQLDYQQRQQELNAGLSTTMENLRKTIEQSRKFHALERKRFEGMHHAQNETLKNIAFAVNDFTLVMQTEMEKTQQSIAKEGQATRAVTKQLRADIRQFNKVYQDWTSTGAKMLHLVHQIESNINRKVKTDELQMVSVIGGAGAGDGIPDGSSSAGNNAGADSGIHRDGGTIPNGTAGERPGERSG